MIRPQIMNVQHQLKKISVLKGKPFELKSFSRPRQDFKNEELKSKLYTQQQKNQIDIRAYTRQEDLMIIQFDFSPYQWRDCHSQNSTSQKSNLSNRGIEQKIYLEYDQSQSTQPQNIIEKSLQNILFVDQKWIQIVQLEL
ncbi:UNKNOWN [Stylonychia lemnae]|uniref:Uncharacterized protein n=1 Tax=Stylonychia lemnae TaxID=5949 RepID=A0A078B4C2_STYLE|nr:UNKNOWN [Stylonychia lemnae]|eukprot:CDW89324.1 UNKNOWN [Stylonychia lemnae]